MLVFIDINLRRGVVQVVALGGENSYDFRGRGCVTRWRLPVMGVIQEALPLARDCEQQSDDSKK